MVVPYPEWSWAGTSEKPLTLLTLLWNSPVGSDCRDSLRLLLGIQFWHQVQWDFPKEQKAENLGVNGIVDILPTFPESLMIKQAKKIILLLSIPYN